jgi:hypothetical protein
MAQPAFPYGRGDTGPRIAAIVDDFLAHPRGAPESKAALPCPADP